MWNLRIVNRDGTVSEPLNYSPAEIGARRREARSGRAAIIDMPHLLVVRWGFTLFIYWKVY